MNNKQFIEKMEDELVPDNKDKIKQRLGIYEVKKQHNYSFMKPLIAFATVFALCFGLFAFFSHKESLTIVGKTYVSFDVNPSIEFVIDENMTVTTCTPKNDKAKILLVNSNYVGKNIEEVTDSLVKKLNDTGYISIINKKNAIMVTTINEDDKSQKHIQETINNKITNYFMDNHIFGVVINGDNVVDTSLKDQADKNNISVGKMKIINSIINSFDINDVNRPTIEQLKDKKISELENILEDIDDAREDALDDFEDDLEELLELLEDYFEQFVETEEDEDDEEDDDDDEKENLVSYFSLEQEQMEEEINNYFNNILEKWGKELLKNIVIDFTKIIYTISQLEALIDALDDLDDNLLTSIDSNNEQFKIKQFNSLKEKESSKINNINKQDYIDDFEDNYEDWLKENMSKYEEDWYFEKEKWDQDFD